MTIQLDHLVQLPGVRPAAAIAVVPVAVPLARLRAALGARGVHLHDGVHEHDRGARAVRRGTA